VKRTPLERSTPLARTGRLPRRTRIKARNAKRGGSRFPKRRDPAYCAWIRTHPCVAAGRGDWIDGGKPCAGRVECAHVVSRGAGGPDVANTVPLCTRHHREQHTIGIRSFETRYGLNLEMKALYFGAIQPPKWDRGRAAARVWADHRGDEPDHPECRTPTPGGDET
jgi:hypothetical protein